jgi:hypothetical protein
VSYRFAAKVSPLCRVALSGLNCFPCCNRLATLWRVTRAEITEDRCPSPPLINLLLPFCNGPFLCCCCCCCSSTITFSSHRPSVQHNCHPPSCLILLRPPSLLTIRLPLVRTSGLSLTSKLIYTHNGRWRCVVDRQPKRPGRHCQCRSIVLDIISTGTSVCQGHRQCHATEV